MLTSAACRRLRIVRSVDGEGRVSRLEVLHDRAAGRNLDAVGRSKGAFRCRGHEVERARRDDLEFVASGVVRGGRVDGLSGMVERDRAVGDRQPAGIHKVAADRRRVGELQIGRFRAGGEVRLCDGEGLRSIRSAQRQEDGIRPLP